MPTLLPLSYYISAMNLTSLLTEMWYIWGCGGAAAFFFLSFWFVVIWGLVPHPALFQGLVSAQNGRYELLGLKSKSPPHRPSMYSAQWAVYGCGEEFCQSRYSLEKSSYTQHFSALQPHLQIRLTSITNFIIKSLPTCLIVMLITIILK